MRKLTSKQIIFWQGQKRSWYGHIGYCYVMQAVVCFSYLGDKCLLHAKQMRTALTQLLIFRFSYLITNKG